MCKLISNSKIKFALASLQMVLKQRRCFLWLLPLFLHLNKNKHNQTVTPTHLPYGLFAGFLTAVGEVSLFCSTSLLSALLQKRWTLTLPFRVTTSLYEFACICLFLWLPILLCSPLSDSKPGKKKSHQLSEIRHWNTAWWAAPLLKRMLDSIIRSPCNKNFCLCSCKCSCDAGRAGLAGFLDDPHLDSCSSTHSGFHRCQCWLPTVEKLNLCMLANVQTVPSL